MQSRCEIQLTQNTALGVPSSTRQNPVAKNIDLWLRRWLHQRSSERTRTSESGSFLSENDWSLLTEGHGKPFVLTSKGPFYGFGAGAYTGNCPKTIVALRTGPSGTFLDDR